MVTLFGVVQHSHRHGENVLQGWSLRATSSLAELCLGIRVEVLETKFFSLPGQLLCWELAPKPPSLQSAEGQSFPGSLDLYGWINRSHSIFSLWSRKYMSICWKLTRLLLFCRTNTGASWILFWSCGEGIPLRGRVKWWKVLQWWAQQDGLEILLGLHWHY